MEKDVVEICAAVNALIPHPWSCHSALDAVVLLRGGVQIGSAVTPTPASFWQMRDQAQGTYPLLYTFELYRMSHSIGFIEARSPGASVYELQSFQGAMPLTARRVSNEDFERIIFFLYQLEYGDISPEKTSDTHAALFYGIPPLSSAELPSRYGRILASVYHLTGQAKEFPAPQS